MDPVLRLRELLLMRDSDEKRKVAVSSPHFAQLLTDAAPRGAPRLRVEYGPLAGREIGRPRSIKAEVPHAVEHFNELRDSIAVDGLFHSTC